MQTQGATSFATLTYLGHALSDESRATAVAAAHATNATSDAARVEALSNVQRHAVTYNALATAVRVQDGMVGDLLEAVDRPWLDSAEGRRERLRRREQHAAWVRDGLADLAPARAR